MNEQNQIVDLQGESFHGGMGMNKAKSLMHNGYVFMIVRVYCEHEYSIEYTKRL